MVSIFNSVLFKKLPNILITTIMKENTRKPKSPNILIIITDQLSQKALSCYGDKYATTPNIDKIINSGVRFSNVYTTCPLCQPSRASFWTSLYPHQTGIVDNMPTEPTNGFNRLGPILDSNITTLGEVFLSAGYTTRHFGKMHDAGSLLGFECDDPYHEIPVKDDCGLYLNVDTTRDRYTTVRCTEFLKQNHIAPFMVVADLNNPHNICGWVGENEIAEDINGLELPQLPDNFETYDMDTRAIGIQYLCCTHPRLAQASHWSSHKYRNYLAAYYGYIKRVDDEIGKIMMALKDGGHQSDTLVVFFSDHGDGMASHRMVTKRLSFYEETTRVPLAFAGFGVSQQNKLVDKPLISLLDIAPTLCDYAGIEIPQSFQGKSLLYYLNGKGAPVERDYIVSQWHAEWDDTYEPGRMLRSNGYKYIKYAENNDEELYDIVNDPLEKVNLSKKKEHKMILEYHRNLFTRYLESVQDPFETLHAKVDKRCRSHKRGYVNHVGGCARDLVS